MGKEDLVALLRGSFSLAWWEAKQERDGIWSVHFRLCSDHQGEQARKAGSLVGRGAGSGRESRGCGLRLALGWER